MDESLIPVIVAVLGATQIGMAIYFGRRQNEASADKDDALAIKAMGDSYSTLIIRLETRIESLEERCTGYEDTIDKQGCTIAKLELKCAQYEIQLEELDLD